MAFFSVFSSEADNSVETFDIVSPDEVHSWKGLYVLIREQTTNEPLLNIRLFSDLSLPFKESQVIEDQVLIGWGDSFAIFNLLTKCSSVIPQDGYFSNFRMNTDLVYICSSSDITCISLDGDVKWRSEPIAIDGVIIDSFDEHKVYASGEWDPPGGWEPCELNILTGARIK